MAWHRMSTSFSTSAKITFWGSAVKYGGSWGKETKVNKQSHSKVKTRHSLKNIHHNLTTGGAFDVRGYRFVCLYLEVGFFGSKSIIKIRPDSVCYAEHEFQSGVNGR